ncbi:MAG: alpha-E domain-containing protein, partial [Cyanobacteria bacterium J06648_10]
MLSRVADAIYWLNRYIERAENVDRFVEDKLHMLMD